MTEPLRALQVCPGDQSPFLELCRNHAAALQSIGVTTDTVFLGAPRDIRWERATYLGIERGTRRMVDALRSHCAERTYAVVVAHRYRAYQVVSRARLAIESAARVAIAHEFGLFTRRRRRWRQRLVANDWYFAGVSAAVVDALRRDHSALERTLVLPNPVDVVRLDAARLSRPVARERLCLAEGDYIVGVVGRLHAKKRPVLALRGFAAATALPEDARLVFVGDGTLRDALESLVVSLGVGHKVSFVGHVADAAQYFNAFDALLFAPGPTEAFGMALLEGMLAGVPVVCADAPGPRSVLGEDGLYFSGAAAAAADVTDALARCVGLSDEARGRLTRHQRVRAEREFSIAAVAGIYRELLSTDAARRAAAS